MGRHSAADDEDDELAAALASDTTPIAPIEPGVAVVPGAPVPVAGRTGTATGADLRLLRERPALRARCAAAVIVPFVLYTVVLVVLARTDVYLVWVWIPTVLAGVLVGHLLDRAHRATNSP